MSTQGQNKRPIEATLGADQNLIQPPQIPQSSRIALIDYAKGIGIFLVVLGHALRSLVGVVFEPSPLSQTWDTWTYAFHMPLFFFLSGLFVERSLRKPWGVILFSKLKTIAYPYFVWSLLQEILRFKIGAREAPLSELWRILYHPEMQFWFLYALFAISLLYISLRKAQLSISICLALFFLLFVTGVAGIQLGPWSVVYLTRINAIYFAFGALISQKKISQKNYVEIFEGSSTSRLAIAALTGFGMIGLAAALGIAQRPFLDIVLAALGIFASLSLAKCLERLRCFTFVRTWGILSLEIFVAHSIFSAVARVVLLNALHTRNPALHIILDTVIGLYGPIALYQFCLRLNFPYLFRVQPWQPSRMASPSH